MDGCGCRVCLMRSRWGEYLEGELMGDYWNCRYRKGSTNPGPWGPRVHLKWSPNGSGPQTVLRLPAWAEPPKVVVTWSGGWQGSWRWTKAFEKELEAAADWPLGHYLMRQSSNTLKWRRRHLLCAQVNELYLHRLGEHNWGRYLIWCVALWSGREVIFSGSRWMSCVYTCWWSTTRHMKSVCANLCDSSYVCRRGWIV